MKKEKNKRLKLLILIAAVFVIMTSCGTGNPDSQNSPSQNEDAGKKETKEELVSMMKYFQNFRIEK